MRTLSHTEMATFKSCHRKWWYMYILRLERESENIDMHIGTLMHQFLAIYYTQGQQAALDFIQAHSYTLDAATLELVNGMVSYYIKYESTTTLKPPAPGYCDQIYAEYEMQSDVFNHLGFRLKGKADLVVRQGDTVTIWEHKFPAKAKTLIYLTTNDQVDLYHLMGSEMFTGCKVNVVLNIVQKIYPKVPKVTKQNKISRAPITTTPEIYRQAVIDNGENPEDYIDVLTTLSNIQPIVRHPVYHLDRKETIIGVRQWINEMSQYVNNMAPRVGSFLCDQCGYSDICQMGKDNYDRVMNYINQSSWQGIKRR